MMRLVQAGNGAKRDLAVVYHLNAKADDDLRAAFGPDACIVNDTVPQAEIGTYASIGPSGIASLADVLASAQAGTGEGFEVARTILVGYSAGYLGVRTQLQAGEDPDAIVIADGIQAPRPGNVASPELAPWIAYADRARAGDRVFVASHTMQGPTNLLSTWEALQLITGFPLLQTGTLSSPAITSDGKLVVFSYMGNDHQAQGYVVLPKLLDVATTLLSASSGLRMKWLKVIGFAGLLTVGLAVGIALGRRA